MDEAGGWSVLAIGPAEVVVDGDAAADLRRARDVRWACGEGVAWVRIVPTSVTGRAIRACEDGVTVRLDFPSQAS
jgi:hypothetical protein